MILWMHSPLTPFCMVCDSLTVTQLTFLLAVAMVILLVGLAVGQMIERGLL